MSQVSDDVGALMKWAQRSCVLIIDALSRLRSLRSGLHEARFPREGSGLHGLIGMTDVPADIQSIAIEIRDHAKSLPANCWECVDDIQATFPEFLRPIRCKEFWCLTALEATITWLEDIGEAVDASMGWLKVGDNIRTTKPPNWGGRDFTEREYQSHVAACDAAFTKAKGMSTKRAQWLLSAVEREWLMISAYLDRSDDNRSADTEKNPRSKLPSDPILVSLLNALRKGR